MASTVEDKEMRERLLSNVKKEVKQLMEVAAARKFIHEDNGCLVSLCATIEQCLLHGLKRRAVGLFKSSTTLSLLQKIAKTSGDAELIVRMCEEYDRVYCSTMSFNPTSTTIASITTTTTPASAAAAAASTSAGFFNSNHTSSPNIMNVARQNSSISSTTTAAATRQPGILTSAQSFYERKESKSPLPSPSSLTSNPSSLSLFSRKLFNTDNNSTNNAATTPSSDGNASRRTAPSSPSITSSSGSLNQQSYNSSSSKDSLVQTHTLNFSPTFYRGSNCYKFLWIRLALLNKTLPKIIDQIINSSSKYYAPCALIADPVDGPIFSSLLMGPCALEFTRMKSCDHLWSDPNADELIQRHKMHSTFSIHPALNQTFTQLNINTNAIAAATAAAAAANANASSSASASSSTTAPTSSSSSSVVSATTSNAKNTNSSFHFNHHHQLHHFHTYYYGHNHQSLQHHGSFNSSNVSTTSASPKLGLNASVIAKRKASINVLDDITNSPTMLNSNNSAAAASAINKTPKSTFEGGAKKNQNLKGILTSPSYLVASSPTPGGSTASSPNPLSPGGQQTSFPVWQPSSPNPSLSPQPQTPSYSPKNFYPQSGNSPSSGVTVMNTAKEYVESLHQNSKSQIIYGKNHVIVNQREKELAGYLSLHLNYSSGLILKWTPNQIMNAASASSTSSLDNGCDQASSSTASSASPTINQYRTKSAYWDFAMYVDINTIVYLHCHQHENKEATIVLVAQDGVQHPPIRFPKGSHLLQFLTCLESGLAPNGQLDPPLWNDDNVGSRGGGVGKIFPKLHRKSIKQQQTRSNLHHNNENNTPEKATTSNSSNNPAAEDDSDSNQTDFVFRIVNSKANVSVTDMNDSINRRKQQLQYSYSASAAALIAANNNTPASTPGTSKPAPQASSSSNTNLIRSLFSTSLMRASRQDSKSKIVGFGDSSEKCQDGTIELSSQSQLASSEKTTFNFGSFFSSFSKSKSQASIDSDRLLRELDHHHHESTPVKSVVKQMSSSSIGSAHDLNSLKSDHDLASLSSFMSDDRSSLITPQQQQTTTVSATSFPTPASVNMAMVMANKAKPKVNSAVPMTPPPSLGSPASSTLSIDVMSSASSSLIATSSPLSAGADASGMCASPTSPLSGGGGKLITRAPGPNNSSLAVRSSMRSLCDNMKRQILSRAFYGWLAYHRHLKTVSLHLIGLVNCDKDRDEEDEDNDDEPLDLDDEDLEELLSQQQPDAAAKPEVLSAAASEKRRKIIRRKSSYLLGNKKIDDKLWALFMKQSKTNTDKIRLEENKKFFYKMVYYNGIEHGLRKKIWPFLLEHYAIDMNESERMTKDEQASENYKCLVQQWKPYEEYIRVRDNQKKSISIQNVNRSRELAQTPSESDAAKAKEEKAAGLLRNNSSVSNDVFIDDQSHNSSSSSFSLLTRLSSARNIFSKLMNTKPAADVSATIDKSLPLTELNESQEDSSKLSKSEENKNPTREESTGQSGLVQSSPTSSSLNDSQTASAAASSSDNNCSLLHLSASIKDISIIQKKSPDISTSDVELFSAEDSANLTEMTKSYVEKIIDVSREKLEQLQNSTDEDEESLTHSAGGTKTTTTTTAEATSSHQEDKETKKTAKKKGRVSFMNTDDQQSSAQGQVPPKSLSIINSTPMISNSEGGGSKGDKKLARKTSQKNLMEKLNGEEAQEPPAEEERHSAPIKFFGVDSIDREALLNCTNMYRDQTETAPTTLINILNSRDRELIDSFALNIHRIDKDVTRCDRNYWYFTSNENLNKLRNIMYTYVWENLNIGYIQGMCDLVAPLLVIFDDEPMVYSCFKQLMRRMSANFPHGSAMDQHFSNMRSLIQILDSDLFEHMHHRGDYTHFFFSYRWFLLDFKRELKYEDVFNVWETIWAAKYVCSAHFYLFIALALVETYRDIIIDNNMDFTDIIKFFNEMAEKHNTAEILGLARTLIKQLQDLIDNNKDTRLE